MKKGFLILLSLLFCCFIEAREVKITVTPSTAKIYIDGNYQGDGVVVASVKKKEGFIVVKCEQEGYVTLETKIFHSDKRKAVSYTLRRDAFYDITSPSGVVNNYFTIKVSKEFYKEKEDGKRDTGIAWKLIHQIILNYFDEIQTTDIASGFIQTPWQYKSFPEIDKAIRTRITIKEVNVTGDLTFQIKISSEMAPLIGMDAEESYREINRILKDYETIISEFQSRLGKL